MTRTYRSYVAETGRDLANLNTDSPRDGVLIVAHVGGVSLSWLRAHLDDLAHWGAAQENHFYKCLAERREGRSIAKIIGQKAFWKNDFYVDDNVLDPRPDTETLVEAALGIPFETVLDLGTGSGCILVSLLSDRPNAMGLGVDISANALLVAKRNAKKMGVADRIEYRCSNMFDAVGQGTFDLIVSNPPYITLEEMDEIDADVLFEPRIALTDEGDGLAYYRLIASRAKQHLNPLGAVMVEIGHEQGNRVVNLFEAQGFASVEIRKDLNGKDRVVVATL